MKTRFHAAALSAFALTLAIGCGTAGAVTPFVSVSWPPNFSVLHATTWTDGSIITYTTGNQSVIYPTSYTDWVGSAATSGTVGGAVTSASYAVLAPRIPTQLELDFGIPTPQIITFANPVTDPVLLVVFADATSTLDFGPNTLTLVSSHHASLSGSVVTFAGASNTLDDGFGAVIHGTFGPGADLKFNYTSTHPFDTLSPGDINFVPGDKLLFTLGKEPVAAAAAVPEPSSWLLLAGGLGIVGAATCGRARARQA